MCLGTPYQMDVAQKWLTPGPPNFLQQLFKVFFNFFGKFRCFNINEFSFIISKMTKKIVLKRGV